MNVLFIAWDGPQSSYLESLFLPIYGRLGERGFRFHVLQFRWGEQTAIDASRRAAERYGCRYTHHPIYRRPKLLGTAGSVVLGARAVERYVKEHDIDILMPRCALPAAMTLIARRRVDARLLFDADGFSQDERVDFGGWAATGLLYRTYRDVEAQATRLADAVITRTQRAKEVLIARAGPGCDPEKIVVVPNGSDSDVYSPGTEVSRAATRAELGVAVDAPLVVYVGSLGPHYYPDAMMAFFDAVLRRDPRARLVLLTGQREDGEAALRRSGVSPDTVQIRRVPAEEVGKIVAASDLGLSLRAPTFSQRGVSPIKVGEYLLSGTPVLATRGVGDLDEQLDDSVAILTDEPTPTRLRAVAERFLEQRADRDAQRRRCRERGLAVFGLDACVDRYERALLHAVRGMR